MRIAEIHSRREAVNLVRPYTIAGRTISAVDLFYLEIIDDSGHRGLGSACPSKAVTGESQDACADALATLQWLEGQDPRALGRLTRMAQDHLADTPGARAAVDMALYDLLGQILSTPVVDLLGRRRQSPLQTSITVGIQSTESALEEVREYLDRGFRCLKVKIGNDFNDDLERLQRMRELAGPEVKIRVDGNQGYTFEQTARLQRLVETLDLELVEQPLPRGQEADQRRLPLPLRRWVAADEGIHDARDAFELAQRPEACGIFNIKLMKCGGITGAMAISAVAESAGLELMWGCMDESVISISAALHAAYACPRTRYIDLDGSFDLAGDRAVGGFELLGGLMRLVDSPGLGVRLRED